MQHDMPWCVDCCINLLKERCRYGQQGAAYTKLPVAAVSSDVMPDKHCEALKLCVASALTPSTLQDLPVLMSDKSKLDRQ